VVAARSSTSISPFSGPFHEATRVISSEICFWASELVKTQANVCPFFLEQALLIRDCSAGEKVANLEGFGANIYLRNFSAWKTILGFVDADGIYGLMIGYRNMPGVLPKGVSMNHPKSTKEKS
jgi:hypothetical protein